MSWQIPAFSLMAAVLIVGFVWYERSRPPSQIVALVAALAAISVAGRVVFSPIPNVVPVTDITLITGFALGPAPGFAVGALSALVSNLWLGQGPWTPWQMAGWGLVGLGGAWLAVLVRGRIGRLGLAMVCGLAGFAYGALLDLYTMVSFGGEQSLNRYLVLSARGLPFNIAHAAGNVVFALAAGPALIAMLGRYRRRFEFAWSSAGGAGASAGGSGAAGGGPGAIAGVGCAVLIALGVAIASGPLAGSSAAAPAATAAGPGGTTAAPAATTAAPTATAAAVGTKAAVKWLRGAQNRDGGFSFAPDGPSSAVMTGWASLGFESAGINPFDLRVGGKSAISYLKAHVDEVISTGDIERTILVVAGAGANPRRFARVNLIKRLLRRRANNGSWSGQVNLTAFGIMALSTVHKSVGKSADWLAGAQGEFGGWGIAPGAAPDADSTGAALQALAIDHRHTEQIDRGVAFLREIQRDNGGYNLLGGPINSQSTAWAVQGLVAAGVTPGSVLTNGNSPLDYLAARQDGNGHYRYSAASDQTPVWVSAQALSAVTKQAFPIAAVPRKGAGGSKQKGQDKGSGTEANGTGANGADGNGGGGGQSSVGASGGAAAPGGDGAGTGGSAARNGDRRAGGGSGGADAPLGNDRGEQEAGAPASGLGGGGDPALLGGASAGGDQDSGSLAWLVGGGMALLIAGLLGGWFRYGRGL